MNHKPLFLTVALIALVVIAGAFWCIQKRQVVGPVGVTESVAETPVQTEPGNSIDTSDWRTFTDETLGYELRFPRSIKHVVNEQAFVDNSEKGISFYVISYERLLRKNLNDIDDTGFIDETFSPFIETGNIEVIIRKAIVNDMQVHVVRYLFREEPTSHSMEAWNEGYSVEEVFFQCKENICAIRTIFDQFSQEKEDLFQTIISSIRSVK